MTKKLIALFILASMLLTASCGDTKNPDPAGETTPSGETTEAADDYKYEKNFGGREFKILSTADDYGMHMEFDRDEVTGETVNDAIFNRNRLV